MYAINNLAINRIHLAKLLREQTEQINRMPMRHVFCHRFESALRLFLEFRVK